MTCMTDAGRNFSPDHFASTQRAIWPVYFPRGQIRPRHPLMTNRQSAAMDRAIRRVIRGATIAEAARKAGVDYSALWRALRRHNITLRRKENI